MKLICLEGSMDESPATRVPRLLCKAPLVLESDLDPALLAWRVPTFSICWKDNLHGVRLTIPLLTPEP